MFIKINFEKEFLNVIFFTKKNYDINLFYYANKANYFFLSLFAFNFLNNLNLEFSYELTIFTSLQLL